MSTQEIKTNNTTKLRAAIYARVSSDDRKKEGRNLQGQIDMAKDHAAKKGYLVVAEYAEDIRGQSGSDVDAPKLNEAIEAAYNREFDVLIVREFDRLARNIIKQLVVEQEFKQIGVQVEYWLYKFPDTPEGELNKQIRAVIAQYEREKIKQRMKRGRQLKVEAGNTLVAQPPYGYNVVRNDKKEALEINKKEAKIVRLIFNWYLEGLSMRAIAHKLTDMGIPTYADIRVKTGVRKKRGFGEWNGGTIGKMLHNKTYIGIWEYGKNRVIENKQVRNKKNDSIKVEVPAIISKDIFDKVQTKRNKNKQDSKRNTKYQYLFRRLVTCKCGFKMYATNAPGGGKIYLYYKCRSTIDKAVKKYKKCNTKNFSSTKVDTIVWQWIKEILTQPEVLQASLQRYVDSQESELKPLKERLKVIENLLTENKTKLDRLLELYLLGEFEKEMLTEKKQQLEKIINGLEREKWNIETQLNITLTKDRINKIMAYADKVGKVLQDESNETFELKRKIVETLNTSLTLSLENGQQIINVRCYLGEESFNIVSTPINSHRHNTQKNTPFCLTHRFVIS